MGKIAALITDLKNGKDPNECHGWVWAWVRPALREAGLIHCEKKHWTLSAVFREVPEPVLVKMVLAHRGKESDTHEERLGKQFGVRLTRACEAIKNGTPVKVALQEQGLSVARLIPLLLYSGVITYRINCAPAEAHDLVKMYHKKYRERKGTLKLWQTS